MHKELLHRLNRARQNKQPLALVTCLQSGQQSLYYSDGATYGAALMPEQQELAIKAIQSDRCQSFQHGDEEIFFQPFNPPLRMIIVGAVHIAQVLVSLASLCNYQVTVVDPRTAFASDARFPQVTVMTDWPDKAMQILQPDARSAVVTLTHDPKLDDPALAAALDSETFYIGALGSNKTQQARHRRLEKLNYSEAQQARIHGPIGLAIGAHSPAEIAVAIMAEITQCLYGSRK
ncbi:MAG: XdhC family protein [Gammaproteobacteria bacterium]